MVTSSDINRQQIQKQFIMLTDKNDNKVIVNLNSVVDIEVYNNQNSILYYITKSQQEVKESVEQIYKLINE